MLSPTDSPINWVLLILEYSLPQSWREFNWRFWSHCPGWCSESESELDITDVSNCLGTILTYKQSVMSMMWLSWVTVVPVWSPCTVTIGASNYCHFPHDTSFEAIPASMSCQYTSNRNMEFVHTLCCYDNSNRLYLTTVPKHFACVRICF